MTHTLKLDLKFSDKNADKVIIAIWEAIGKVRETAEVQVWTNHTSQWDKDDEIK